MVKIVWTAFAIEDLRLIHDYIAKLRIQKLMLTGLLTN
jgi:plasmid stabilization system protein ParE